MSTPEYELGYFKAGLQMLEDYLLSEDIYWTLGEPPPAGDQPYPELTLGGLLMRYAKLSCIQLDPVLQEAFTPLEIEFDRINQKWRMAVDRKAAHEFHARLILWRDYLEELRQNPEQHVDRYAYEVQRRLMLDLLQSHTASIPNPEMKLMEALDKVLRAILESGPFIWPASCQAAFPPETFWYLYGKPRKK